jgi:hypothetical protein
MRSFNLVIIEHLPKLPAPLVALTKGIATVYFGQQSVRTIVLWQCATAVLQIGDCEDNTVTDAEA